MKYMSFNRACSWAGLANLLADEGVDREDRDLVLQAGLPWLFAWSEAESRYQAGPMLQGKPYFDLALQPLGFAWREQVLDAAAILERLDQGGPRRMVGLQLGATGRHAVIHCGRQDGRHRFLNNRHANSAEPDYLDYAPDELAPLLADELPLGWLERLERPQPTPSPERQVLLAASRVALDRFRADLAGLFDRPLDAAAKAATRDSHFAALFLDLASMLELTGQDGLLECLIGLRSRYLAFVRSAGARLDEAFSRAELAAVLDEYQAWQAAAS
jgi:hypothetical protein